MRGSLAVPHAQAIAQTKSIPNLLRLAPRFSPFDLPSEIRLCRGASDVTIVALSCSRHLAGRSFVLFRTRLSARRAIALASPSSSSEHVTCRALDGWSDTENLLMEGCRSTKQQPHSTSRQSDFFRTVPTYDVHDQHLATSRLLPPLTAD